MNQFLCGTKICILCFATSNPLLSLYSDVGRKLNLAEIITKHFWFQVNETRDDLPQSICIECWNQVELFHNFYMNVETAHEMFYAEQNGIEYVNLSSDDDEIHVKDDFSKDICNENYMRDNVVELISAPLEPKMEHKKLSPDRSIKASPTMNLTHPDETNEEHNIEHIDLDSTKSSITEPFAGFDDSHIAPISIDLRFSLGYAYYLDENGDRIFQLDNSVVKLQDETVKTLKLWNDKYSSIHMDSQFIKKLSLDVFGMEKLRISSVYGSIAHNANVQHERLDAEKLQFVRDIFEHRVGADDRRKRKFAAILNKHCNNARRSYSHKR